MYVMKNIIGIVESDVARIPKINLLKNIQFTWSSQDIKYNLILRFLYLVALDK